MQPANLAFVTKPFYASPQPDIPIPNPLVGRSVSMKRLISWITWQVLRLIWFEFAVGFIPDMRTQKIMAPED
jgi:hypothetical protein